MRGQHVVIRDAFNRLIPHRILAVGECGIWSVAESRYEKIARDPRGEIMFCWPFESVFRYKDGDLIHWSEEESED